MYLETGAVVRRPTPAEVVSRKVQKPSAAFDDGDPDEGKSRQNLLSRSRSCSPDGRSTLARLSRARRSPSPTRSISRLAGGNSRRSPSPTRSLMRPGARTRRSPSPTRPLLMRPGSAKTPAFPWGSTPACLSSRSGRLGLSMTRERDGTVRPSRTRYGAPHGGIGMSGSMLALPLLPQRGSKVSWGSFGSLLGDEPGLGSSPRLSNRNSDRGGVAWSGRPISSQGWFFEAEQLKERCVLSEFF